MTAREQVKEEFNLEDALNTAGFAEFLANFPKAEQMIEKSDVKGVERIYQSFESKKETTRNLKDICKKEIFRDVHINPEDSDLGAIDTYIDAEFQKDPEAAMKLLENLGSLAHEYGASQDRISEKEEQLEKLGGFTKLKEVKGNLKTASGAMGWMNAIRRIYQGKFMSRNENAAVQTVRDNYGITKLAGVKDQLKTVTDAEEALSQFGKMRETFMNSFAPMKEIAELMKTKAQDQLKVFFDHTAPMPADLGTVDLSKLEDAQKYFDRLSGGPESGNIDPLTDKYLEGIDIVAFQHNLDLLTKFKIEKEIRDAVIGHNFSGGSALSRLDRVLGNFLNKEEVGSYKGDDARDFIKFQLRFALSDTATPAANRLLAKVLYKKYFG
jgi:hypothetical protein